MSKERSPSSNGTKTSGEPILKKHQIDFEDVVFALQELRLELRSDRNGEVRILAICPNTERLIAVVYTMRGEKCRIISARAARQNEQRLYYHRYPR
ncbi:BrnT family toxin [Neorhizobium sp. Rsf11]|uniref:BrnT family toxin n=2 Tax=Neorhizobium TaxID=1525371 RepID=A0ABV0M045_9HYPH|nr:BrnT family toxin [Neorhizobium petrolearium]MCC2610607.1 BrnT family toxin [Neorhizobium petrolearium]WGI70744.1 BrnT family toxin [Neorhizobium petrolearium]